MASEHGIHANVLQRWKTEAIQNLYLIFVDDRKGITKMKTDYEQKINDLYAEVGKLTTYNAWLKKNLASETTRETRIALLEWDRPELPHTAQAELLILNRTCLYYNPAPPSPEEIRLKHRVDEMYTLYPFMGSRRIAAMLHQDGETIHRNTVQRYMQEMGLSADCRFAQLY